MTFRKLFVIGAAVAALGVAGAAVAQTAAQKSMIDQAKAQGVVGEQADGYLGFRSSSSDAALRAAVDATNSGRRAAYARSAADAGTSADVAGARMFESQLLPRIQSGQWYRNPQGQWVQR
ncbi:DUF1318 domain-containing protein [Brevundimonas albigilva]|uniref:YdbL family protein n=1 Tax=Brevundimonas albigilva TaxID=1312364 RepID=A0ABY4SL84_9CAUL|nr:DUF1318 domain-containing protein [Brevundimonas albigilva]URI14616.1 YdbL family protein [Brevundimonas albigilva]